LPRDKAPSQGIYTRTMTQAGLEGLAGFTPWLKGVVRDLAPEDPHAILKKGEGQPNPLARQL